MKKTTIIVLALLTIISSFTACVKPENIPAPEESTLGVQEELSYEAYFSTVRPYEMKRPIDTDDYSCYENIDRLPFSIYSGDIAYQNHEESNPDRFYYNGSVDKKKLYIINFDEKRIERTFSDFSVFIDNKEVIFPPFSVRDEGVYVVIDGNRFALLDDNGKLIKEFFSDDTGLIKHFFVGDKVAWVFCNGSIFRIYLPDGKVDKIKSGIDQTAFRCFLHPISNHEIEWLEFLPESVEKPDMVRACYYNDLTGEYKTLDEQSGDSDLSWPAFKGWWFVPVSAYEDFTRLTYELPEKTVSHLYYTKDISCGGGLPFVDKSLPGEYRKNGGNPVGGAMICYDLKPVFQNQEFTAVEGIPEWAGVDDFTVFFGKSRVLEADGVYYDKGYGEKVPYHFAFLCEKEDGPVYCIALRSDLYDIDVFNSIVRSAEIKNQ